MVGIFHLIQALLEWNARAVSASRTRHFHAIPAHTAKLVHWSLGLYVHDPVAVNTSKGINFRDTLTYFLSAEAVKINPSTLRRHNLRIASRIAHILLLLPENISSYGAGIRTARSHSEAVRSSTAGNRRMDKL